MTKQKGTVVQVMGPVLDIRFPEDALPELLQAIEVKNGVARTMEGAIAGSTSNLWTCVNKAVEFGIPFEDAVKMATETPATMIGVNKGQLKEGFDADFVVLNDDRTIHGTYIAGNLYQ